MNLIKFYLFLIQNKLKGKLSQDGNSLLKFLLIFPIIGFLIIFIPYLSCFNYVPYHENGLAWDAATGKSWVQSPGPHFTSPLVMVSSLEMRPIRVCIESNSRVRTCKLVQLNRRYLTDLIELEGFHYYWLSNRFSFNFGHQEESRGIKDVLIGYVFSDNSLNLRYKFYEVLNEY